MLKGLGAGLAVAATMVTTLAFLASAKSMEEAGGGALRLVADDEAARIVGGEIEYDKRCTIGFCIQSNNAGHCVGFSSWTGIGCTNDVCYTSCNNTVTPGYYCLSWAAFTCDLSTDPGDLVGCMMGTKGTCVATFTPGLPGACTYGACGATIPYPCLPISQLCV
jgi:hypothetical protein